MFIVTGRNELVIVLVSNAAYRPMLESEWIYSIKQFLLLRDRRDLECLPDKKVMQHRTLIPTEGAIQPSEHAGIRTK